MVTLGIELTEDSPASVRLWLASATTISDPNVFLIGTGTTPLFARCCTASDLTNYPTEIVEGLGWYRVAGLQFEVRNASDLGARIADLRNALNQLDTELAATGTEEILGASLKYFGNGAEFGTLKATITRHSAAYVSVAIVVTVSDSSLLALLGDPFVSVAGDFPEFRRVVTQNDLADTSPDADEIRSSEITVTLRETYLQPLMAALTADLEDVCTFAAVRESLATP